MQRSIKAQISRLPLYVGHGITDIDIIETGLDAVNNWESRFFEI